MTPQRIVIGLIDLEGDKKKKLEEMISSTTLQYDHAAAFEKNIPNNRYLEIMGAWEDQCVSAAVITALKQKKIIRLPKNYLFKFSEDKSGITKVVKHESGSLKYYEKETENHLYFFPKPFRYYRYFMNTP